MARQLGWDTWVWEPRNREATAARFASPAGAPVARLLARGVTELGAAVATAARPLAVVMSHDFRIDAEALTVLLPSRALHIGVLGPRRRTEKLLATLAAQGGAPPDPWRRLSAPVGLALGAETPEEIALAIVAEAQAVLAGESAGFLRSRQGPVHAGRTAASGGGGRALDLEAAE
jgi:xanthine/CO dehydrogenase XdhC/CoxF family maturation factor